MAVSKRAIDEGSGLRTLYNGDRMRQAEFHVAYSQMPEGYRAELVGGIVFEPSPLGYSHGRNDSRLTCLLETYVIATPGVEAASNATVILGDEDEVQPDILLRVIQKCGGQSRVRKYIVGAPELVAEIANTSRAMDLHIKKQRYALAGVREYIVVTVQPAKLYWFDLQKDLELSVDDDGVVRSAVFPGLWIHQQGLLDLDASKTLNALNSGLMSPEHALFKAQLADARRPRKRK